MTHKLMKVLLFLFLFIILIGLGITAYFLYTSNESNKLLLQKINKLEEQNNETQKDTVSSSSSSFQKETEEFTDSRLIGFTIPYSKNDWSVTVLGAKDEYKKNNTVYMGPGILFEEKGEDGGILHFKFSLAFGIGGGVSLYTKDDMKLLTNGWVWFKGTNGTMYGSVTHLTPYDKNPKELASAKDFCSKLKNGEEDMYPLFDGEQCAGIESGNYIGYVPEPAFTRSPRFKMAVTLAEINEAWASDEYVKTEKLDDGYMIVETSYKGNNSEDADTLVEHLKPVW